ncbi:hypothetical protein M885DRAFT_533527 [Pelagophyceae sp. CCMP2097]|nr:hypothetical protein M885DRAFT_533527 [Pelagophyceae sp. CCMP2097]
MGGLGHAAFVAVVLCSRLFGGALLARRLPPQRVSALGAARRGPPPAPLGADDAAPKLEKSLKVMARESKAALWASEARAEKEPVKLSAKAKIAMRRAKAEAAVNATAADAPAADAEAAEAAATEEVAEEEAYEDEVDERRRDERRVDERLLLRGVASAESEYARAEMASAALATGQRLDGRLDASELAAATLLLNQSSWPTCYLIGLDITSRRGSIKMVEQRNRGGSGAKTASQKALGAATAVDWTVAQSLAELAKLCETARLRVDGSTFQRLEAANGNFLVGRGKVAEVALEMKRLDVDAVVFDDELSLAQQKSVTAELRAAGCRSAVQVLDRTQLVLQIFSERARTREAKAQVELARAEYMLPRLTTFLTLGAGLELRGGSASGGGGGSAPLRGAGETQLEMDKRLFERRMTRLRAEIDEVATKRAFLRERRVRDAEALPLVCLVGYTNAGKTSLLNALADATEPLYADDKLFATLDPTTRRVTLPTGRACKLTDTVGFLQKLPTRLIASFRATLEEIADAGLLIHVIDTSSPMAAAHVAAVDAIILELGCAHIPQIRVFNKYDRRAEVDRDEKALWPEGFEGFADADAVAGPPAAGPPAAAPPAAGRRPGPRAARTVATHADGVDELLAEIDKALAAMNSAVTVFLPFAEGALLNEIHTIGTVVESVHDEGGTRIKAFVPDALKARLRPFRLRIKRLTPPAEDAPAPAQ